MSLVRTLAKVAIGVLVVQGVKGALAGRGGRAARPGTESAWDGGGGSLGETVGEALGGGGRGRMATGTAGGAAFEDELGRFGGGASGTPAGTSGGGGFGDLLESLGAAPGGTGGTAGSLDDAIGQLGRGGGLGDLLGGILGGAAAGGALGGAAGGRIPPAPSAKGDALAQGSKGFGQVLNEAFTKEGEVAAAPEHEAVAALLLRAMIQAAKADGRIDAGEKQRILKDLGDASEAELAFVRQELAADIDIAGLARQVPAGLAAQVYGASVMAISLDTRQEAQYLHALADAMGLSPAQVNAIHGRLGVRELYS